VAWLFIQNLKLNIQNLKMHHIPPLDTLCVLLLIFFEQEVTEATKGLARWALAVFQL